MGAAGACPCLGLAVAFAAPRGRRPRTQGTAQPTLAEANPQRSEDVSPALGAHARGKEMRGCGGSGAKRGARSTRRAAVHSSRDGTHAHTKKRGRVRLRRACGHEDCGMVRRGGVGCERLWCVSRCGDVRSTARAMRLRPTVCAVAAPRTAPHGAGAAWAAHGPSTSTPARSAQAQPRWVLPCTPAFVGRVFSCPLLRRGF